MDNKDFIKTYENVISHSFCDDLIHKFENMSSEWESRNKLTTDRNLSFKELHWQKNPNTWKEESNALTNIFIEYIDDYKSQFSKFCFPDKYALEPFKMKKYEPNGVDEFGWHVDVNGTGNMERFLAFFLISFSRIFSLLFLLCAYFGLYTFSTFLIFIFLSVDYIY